ncbi:MAG: excalibur calcium-binding domain-containing protein, partial [Rhizobiaceae bacterium]
VVPSKTSGRAATTTSFKCDGRTHCSQMTSCEEATFFLRNCPNVKMDGNNDGVPCEKQWCNR